MLIIYIFLKSFAIQFNEIDKSEEIKVDGNKQYNHYYIKSIMHYMRKERWRK